MTNYSRSGGPTDLVQNLLSAKTSEDELKHLREFRSNLIPPSAALISVDSDDDLFEKQYYDHIQSQDLDDASLDSPFPGKQPDQILKNQQNLNLFMCYLFERRYGWSEAKADEKVKKIKKQEAVNAEFQHKASLNDLLDELLKWNMCQKMNASLLESLKYSIIQAANKPVVRNQTIIHTLEWLKMNGEYLKEHKFDLVKALLLLGLTDVWSAIRNATVSRLNLVMVHFTMEQLESFFIDLVTICQDEDSLWQAKEGAVMGVTVLVRCFQWMGFSTEEENSNPVPAASPKTGYCIKFGKQEMDRMPEFITKRIKEVIFPLLANPQLSIRENATKAFSSYLSRCEFKDALSAFRDVIAQLCKGTLPPDGDINAESFQPHLAVLNPDFQFMDAYAAQGLLGVCVFLVKHIPPGFLLPNWPLYFSTFSLYLMHPASTVRQATSTIFKYLVAKDSNNPTILKLVLQGLCELWHVSMDILSHPCNMKHFVKLNDVKNKDTDAQNNAAAHSNAKTEKRTDFHKDKPLYPTRQRSYSFSVPRKKRTTITDLGSNARESHIQDTWEWREGRLFAYELIFQFLIKNHWLYTFGPQGSHVHQSGSSPVIGGTQKLSSSVDDAIPKTRSHKSVKKISSYGGSVLHNAMKYARASPDSNASECDSLTDTIPEEGRVESPAMSSHNSAQLRRLIWMKNRGLSQDNVYSNVGILNNEPVPSKSFRNVSVDYSSQVPSLGTQVKHFSKIPISKTPFRAPSIPFMSTKTMSLLSHTLLVDRDQQRMPETQKKTVKDEKGSTSPGRDQEFLRSCLCPSPLSPKNDGSEYKEPKWLSTLELKPLSKLLKSMLYQGIECLADTRWELRRMGQQVLPCLVEVIRWYDMTILEDLWNEHLTPKTTLLCYGASVALKYSIAHAAKLVPMVNDPPVSWQDINGCKQVVQKIIDSITRSLQRRMTCVNSLLHRHCFDKLSLVNMEVLMLVHTHFKEKDPQISNEVKTVVNFFQQVFLHAHPSNKLGIDIGKVVQLVSFVTPRDGFLSFCSPKEDGGIYCSKLVEKHLLSEVCPYFSLFLSTTQVLDIISLLPIMAFFVGEYIDDEKVSNSMFHSLASVVASLIDCVTKESLTPEKQLEVERYGNWTLRELANLISLKSLELHTLRQVLDVYIALSPLVTHSQHLKQLFQAIGSRTSSVPDSRYTNQTVENLVILSNDITTTEPFAIPKTPESESDDEDEKALDTASENILQESLILTTSNNSGSGPSGRLSALSGCSGPSGRLSALSGGSYDRMNSQNSNLSEEADSDWDSWSEDEEDITALSKIFCDFLRSLHRTYSKLSIEEDKTSAFVTELRGLSDKERKTVKSVLEGK